MTLNSEDPSRKIKCYLQDEAVRKIILYSEGENISLSGVCEGYISGVVKFEKCLIVSQNSVSGGASINTMDDRQLERMNYLQSTHADFCRQMFQRHRMTRYRGDVAECLSTLNRFLTIWPKNLRNDDGNEVKQASDFLKSIQHVVYGTLEIVEGDFSKEELNLAFENGYRGVSLGNTILRVETAAIVACNMVAVKNFKTE